MVEGIAEEPVETYVISRYRDTDLMCKDYWIWKITNQVTGKPIAPPDFVLHGTTILYDIYSAIAGIYQKRPEDAHPITWERAEWDDDTELKGIVKLANLIDETRCRAAAAAKKNRRLAEENAGLKARLDPAQKKSGAAGSPAGIRGDAIDGYSHNSETAKQ